MGARASCSSRTCLFFPLPISTSTSTIQLLPLLQLLSPRHLVLPARARRHHSEACGFSFKSRTDDSTHHVRILCLSSGTNTAPAKAPPSFTQPIIDMTKNRKLQIACLQLDSKLGKVTENITRADKILEENFVNPRDIDLLVLPELCFTGYNFESSDEIAPYLEEQGKGPTSLWAERTSRKLHCYVIAGYPEVAASRDSDDLDAAATLKYNSCILTAPNGNILVNYRKTHLFDTDKPWAQEGPKFYSGELDLNLLSVSPTEASDGDQGSRESAEPNNLRIAIGICMDLNPKNFTAPFSKFEFANHARDAEARLIIIPMAWLRSPSSGEDSGSDHEPDMRTLRYWLARLGPLLEGEGDDENSNSGDREVIFIASNRIGTERERTFAGTSAAVGLSKNQATIYGYLGKGVEGLLKVDLDLP